MCAGQETKEWVGDFGHRPDFVRSQDGSIIEKLSSGFPLAPRLNASILQMGKLKHTHPVVSLVVGLQTFGLQSQA